MAKEKFNQAKKALVGILAGSVFLDGVSLIFTGDRISDKIPEPNLSALYQGFTQLGPAYLTLAFPTVKYIQGKFPRKKLK